MSEQSNLGAAPPSFMARFLSFRRGPWENIATLVIAAGVLMLMQPFAIELYTWSFAVTLVGTAMFVIVSKFPE